MRFYRVDLLDFYRGTLSARRLQILIRQLPAKSALVLALNGGRSPWSTTDHLIADLWILMLQIFVKNPRHKDHPVRVEMQAKARHAAKLARVVGLRAVFEKRKRAYGIGE